MASLVGPMAASKLGKVGESSSILSKFNSIKTSGLSNVKNFSRTFMSEYSKGGVRSSFLGSGEIGKVTDAFGKAIGKQAGGVVNDIITDGSHLSDRKLKPNSKYITGEFEYTYKTDDMGRLPHNANTPGKLAGDHAGHLAGDRFGGSPDIDNLVSQLSDVNLSSYKKIENIWARALKEGKQVTTNVKVNYDVFELRPISFDIDYTIDGKWFSKHIEN